MSIRWTLVRNLRGIIDFVNWKIALLHKCRNVYFSKENLEWVAHTINKARKKSIPFTAAKAKFSNTQKTASETLSSTNYLQLTKKGYIERLRNILAVAA